jgi:hypothetical protein
VSRLAQRRRERGADSARADDADRQPGGAVLGPLVSGRAGVRACVPAVAVRGRGGVLIVHGMAAFRIPFRSSPGTGRPAAMLFPGAPGGPPRAEAVRLGGSGRRVPGLAGILRCLRTVTTG